MTFTTSIRTCFRKYFTFSGRATRPEYWWFVLFLLLAGIISGMIDSAIYGDELIETHVIDEQTYATIETAGPFESIFRLLTVLPFLAVGWRRMHDTGRSGLHLFYPLIVMIGIGTFAGLTGAMPDFDGTLDFNFDGITGIILVIASVIFIISPFLVIWWLTRPSEPGTNQYGPNPRKVLQ